MTVCSTWTSRMKSYVIDLGDGPTEVEVLAGLDSNLEAIAEAGLVLCRERVTALTSICPAAIAERGHA